MEQDYLMRQINRFGEALGKILAGLLGLKQSGDLNGGLEMTRQVFRDELDLNLDSLLEIRTDRFVESLKNEKGFTDENLVDLADILMILADNNPGKDSLYSKSLYDKCLVIYQYLESADRTFSLDRQYKIEKIKKLT
jgi:hypothetical protein